VRADVSASPCCPAIEPRFARITARRVLLSSSRARAAAARSSSPSPTAMLPSVPMQRPISLRSSSSRKRTRASSVRSLAAPGSPCRDAHVPQWIRASAGVSSRAPSPRSTAPSSRRRPSLRWPRTVRKFQVASRTHTSESTSPAAANHARAERRLSYSSSTRAIVAASPRRSRGDASAARRRQAVRTAPRSPSSSRSWLHSSAARSVRCRAGRSRAPPVRRLRNWSRRRLSAGGGSAWSARRRARDHAASPLHLGALHRSADPGARWAMSCASHARLLRSDRDGARLDRGGLPCPNERNLRCTRP
jgi:hypothetical protein